MSHEREKENEDNQNIQSAEENQYVQVKMKEKQRELGTESRLNASIESGYKREITIYSILLATAVTSLEIYNSFHPTIYSSQKFYPLFVKNPENSSAQQKLSKSNKLKEFSAIEDKDDRN